MVTWTVTVRGIFTGFGPFVRLGFVLMAYSRCVVLELIGRYQPGVHRIAPEIA
jgi:hypothetical protein